MREIDAEGSYGSVKEIIAKVDEWYDEEHFGVDEWAETVWNGVDDGMEEDMKKLYAYVKQRVDRISQYSVIFFQEQHIKQLFQKIYKVMQYPNLSEFDRLVLEDLLDYIRAYDPLGYSDVIEEQVIQDMSNGLVPKKGKK